jgi:hypothetical protein
MPGDNMAEQGRNKEVDNMRAMSWKMYLRPRTLLKLSCPHTTILSQLRESVPRLEQCNGQDRWPKPRYNSCRETKGIVYKKLANHRVKMLRALKLTAQGG